MGVTNKNNRAFTDQDFQQMSSKDQQTTLQCGKTMRRAGCAAPTIGALAEQQLIQQSGTPALPAPEPQTQRG